MSFYLSPVFFLSILLLSACATTKVITVEQPQSGAAGRDQTAMAGAVSVDITPPPGLPMGGYSIMANKGKGFRTRLKARIIYLTDGAGSATALVQTDLTAGSLLVHHQVSSAVAKSTGLKPADIVIAATHTHSAPVNFFDNDFYNKHMSSGSGLDARYLAFLTERLSAGIEAAYRRRRPAKVATGSKAIYGYNRNRSLAAYVLNENINEADFKDNGAVFRAVNPSLNMIRIDVENAQGEFSPLAAFSSFSVHATALSPEVEVYNADLFAYAQKDLERIIQNRYHTAWPVVHAMTTGTQGDMAPALRQQGDNTLSHFDLNWPEAKYLGQNIASEAVQLFESLGAGLTREVKLETAAREINIRKHHVVEDVVLCEDAAVGAPVVGGAYERRTPWLSLIPFFQAGNVLSHRWFFTEGCQGNKSHAGFSFIQSLLEPKGSFPQIAMFQMIRINDALILPLPFEVTIEAGRRITSCVKTRFNKKKKDKVKRVWISSNANGYFGYTTTREEYVQQNYEGGHTLYGRYSTPYIKAQLSLLASDLSLLGSVNEMLPQWRYRLETNEFYPEHKTSTGNRAVVLPPTVHYAQYENEENYVYF
ncbi:MAG TPA: hypothetical protein ENK06_05960, partial [Gammaproteobacteria bacterium]|nr:hypothetical protein [Gammaproteobacteria bacterium]